MLCLQTYLYRFIYTFASECRLIGTVQGDNYANKPEAVFNLRSLEAIYLAPAAKEVLKFDNGFGQFKLQSSETIVSGSHSLSGSFFSISYRNNEACIYNANRDKWVTKTWEANSWYVKKISETGLRSRDERWLPQTAKLIFLNPAIA